MSTSEQSVPQPPSELAATPPSTAGEPVASQPPIAQAPSAPGSSVLPSAHEPVEIVPRGILFSLAAIPLGMALSILIWKLGFIASISSFAVAAAAVWLYAKGATQAPKRGLAAVVGVIVVGVVASFFAIVAADLVEYFHTAEGQTLGYSSSVDFVSANLFNTGVLSSYGSDLVMYVVFAALGIFSTLRRLVAHRRA